MNNKFTIDEFLQWEQASRDTIDLKRIYVDVANDLVTGLLLSQIVFWNLPNKEGKTKLRVWHDNKLWLAKGRADWWEECRISPKQFDRSIAILEKKGIVITALKKFNGSPMKHIYLDFEKLIKAIGKIFEQQTEGKMDFTQRSKSDLTKSENGISPSVKIDLHETVKSITETTPQTTSKNTYRSKPVDRFNDYEQRNYDYDDLERKLLGWEVKE